MTIEEMRHQIIAEAPAPVWPQHCNQSHCTRTPRWVNTVILSYTQAQVLRLFYCRWHQRTYRKHHGGERLTSVRR